MQRKTICEINLDAIRHNLTAIKKIVGHKVKILLPVKADAYGHGMIEVSRFTEKNSLVDMLGVASLDEGIELRIAGITLPILVLGLIVPGDEQIRVIFDYGLSQTVASAECAGAISRTAAESGKKASLHLKIDTGMGRIGCRPEKAVDICRKIRGMRNIRLEGIYSHFPDADGPDRNFTLSQIRLFTDICARLEKEGIDIPLKHLANSAGIVNYPESHFTMVRPGIMTYGYPPSPGMNLSFDLIPSMTVKSTVVFIKKVPADFPLSYGLTYRTGVESTIATVPIGYGDGYSRFLSNKGKVIIRGKQYPVVGRVSMDQILINLGDDEYPPGEEVLIFGGGDINASTLAEWIGTIPYEVTCAISKRVPRIYIE